jgi:hypothetical protein
VVRISRRFQLAQMDHRRSSGDFPSRGTHFGVLGTGSTDRSLLKQCSRHFLRLTFYFVRSAWRESIARTCPISKADVFTPCMMRCMIDNLALRIEISHDPIRTISTLRRYCVRRECLTNTQALRYLYAN